MKYLALVILLATIGRGLSAQQVKILPPFSFNCTTLPYLSEGCTSYNEMVAKQDKDLMGALKNGTTLVCFRPGEDVFFLISHNRPGDGDFSKSPNPNTLHAFGFLAYDRYKDGVLDYDAWLIGDWTKSKLLDVPASFVAADKGTNANAIVTETEIAYSYTFENLSHTKTNYSVQVRESTLRFSETYTFPDLPTPNTPRAATPSETQANYTGHCAEFN